MVALHIDNEIFNQIPNHPRYFITNKGRIWDTKENGLIHPKEKNGLLKIQIYIPEKRHVKVVSVVYLVWITFSSQEVSQGEYVKQKDGDIHNLSFSNLMLFSKNSGPCKKYRARTKSRKYSKPKDYDPYWMGTGGCDYV